MVEAHLFGGGPLGYRGGVAEIETRGLKEFRRELRKAPKAVKDSIKVANKALADQVIADAERMADTPIENKAFAGGAVKSTKRASGAVILLDAKRFGGVLGAELGAIWYDQFEPWLGNQSSGFEWEQGYMVGTALSANLAVYEESYLDAILDALAPSYPD